MRKPDLTLTYYMLLGLSPLASGQDVRSAYRELSKRYHPDTTDLPAAIATEKFQQLNEAYATLSSPERRLIYDQKMGLRLHVIQSSQRLPATSPSPFVNVSSTDLDPSDRPLSSGELFALFLLGATLIACLLLAIIIGLTRGETAFRPLELSPPVSQSVSSQNQRLPGDQLSSDYPRSN